MMTEILVVVLATVCMLSGLLLRYAPMASLITPKMRRTLLICYGIALAVFAVALSLWFRWVRMSIAVVKNFSVLFAVTTATMNILVVRHRLQEHLFVFGIVIVCNYVLLAIPFYIATLLKENGVAVQPYQTLSLYALLLLLTFCPLRKLLRNTVEPFLHMDSGNYWAAIWFVPIGVFVMLIANTLGNDTVGTLAEVIGSISCAVAMLMMCWKIAKDHKQMYEQQIIVKQMESQKLQYVKLQAKVEEARKTGHDFKHFANAMDHYLRNDDMEGLRKFCEEIIGQLNRVSPIENMGSSMADAVLNRYVDTAKEEQIEMRVQGRIQCSWINDMDICVILGNLLDNAIEGCRTIPDGRRMAVTIQNTDEELNILIQNTYDGVVNMDGDEMTSRKRRNVAGVGLQSVRELCEKYDGMMEIYPGGQLFSVSVLLRQQS